MVQEVSKAATVIVIEECTGTNQQGFQESSGAKRNDEGQGAALGSARSIDAPMVSAMQQSRY